MYDYSRIEEQALELLKSNNMLKSPAVNVKQLAKKMGIEIEERMLNDEISGLLIIKNSKAVIGLNHNQGPQRERFTIAHEIGHFSLHQSVKSTFVDEVVFARSRSKDQFEREANAFAAALLMPAPLVLGQLEKRNWSVITDAEIDLLAQEFKVSEPAMTYRLVNLKIIEPPLQF